MAIIHTAGLKPLSYGSAILGISDYELKRARATLLSFKSPSHRGASLVAKCVLHGDPVTDAAVAPAVQWAIAVWQSAVAPERALFTIDELTHMYDTISSKYVPGQTWGQSGGPISRMMLSLRRIGWEVQNVTEWVDDRGIEYSL
eukprot:9400737-Pyramimonas_sp.AAC.1